MQTLTKASWLLVVCGVLEATYSAVNLLMQAPNGTLTLRTFFLRGTVVFLGSLALGAGACAIAAGIWSFTSGKSLPLVLNGLALSALGLIFMFWKGRLTFRTVAVLLVAMAITIGVLALVNARSLRRHDADRWFLGLAGAASVGFASMFLALGFRWIKVVHPEMLNVWMSSYFAFSAACMLWLGLRLQSLRCAALKSFNASVPI